MLNKIIKNKKADERWISPMLFLVWIIIGGGIVLGVIIFYSASIDVRESEAEILATRLSDCLIENWNLTDILSNNFDIFSKCSLTEEIIQNQELYFIDITIFDKADEIAKIQKGVLSFGTLCDLQEKKESSNLPKCYEKEVFIRDNNKDYLIKIRTASNQLGKKL
jgi:hypothetical protein